MKYEFRECVGARFRRLSRIIDIEFRNKLVNYDITENQMTILFVLKKTGTIDQGKIGEFLVLKRSTISRNIKLLEKLDFVSKSVDYRPTITLTKKGETLIEKLIPIWENIMDTFVKKLGSDGMNCLSTMEKKLI